MSRKPSITGTNTSTVPWKKYCTPKIYFVYPEAKFEGRPEQLQRNGRFLKARRITHIGMLLSTEEEQVTAVRKKKSTSSEPENKNAEPENGEQNKRNTWREKRRCAMNKRNNRHGKQRHTRIKRSHIVDIQHYRREIEDIGLRNRTPHLDIITYWR